MSEWRFDTERWPLVYYAAVGSLTNEQIDEFLRVSSAGTQNRGKYVAVMDASKIGAVSAYMRSRIISAQKELRSSIERDCLGVAYVLSSPLLRFVAMTILLVTSLPVPYKVFTDTAEALAWAEQRVRDATATETSPSPPG